jgi:signal transduction histidine kinase
MRSRSDLRILAILILSFCLTSFSVAQEYRNVDKLKSGIESSDGIEQIDLLNTLAFNLVYPDPAATEKCANEALNKAQEISYPKGQYTANQMLGLACWRLKKYSEASHYYTIGLQQAREAGDLVIEANILGNLGILYGQFGILDQAAEYQRLSLEAHIKSGNLDRLTVVYGNFADMLCQLGQYEEALESANLAIKHSLNQNDFSYAITLTFLSDIYLEMGEYAKALELLEESMALSLKDGHDWISANNYKNLAILERRKGDLSKSNEYLLLARDHAIKVDEVLLMLKVYTLLRMNALDLDDYKAALEYTDLYEEFHVEFTDSISLLAVEEARHEVEQRVLEEKTTRLEQENLFKQETINSQVLILVLSLIAVSIACILVITLAQTRRRLKRNLQLVSKQKEDLTNKSTELALMAESLSSFVYTVSHDIKTPLWKLDSWLQILKSEVQVCPHSNKDEELIVNKLQKSVREMHTLVEEILDYATSANLDLKLTNNNVTSISYKIAGVIEADNPSLNFKFDFQDNLEVIGDKVLVKLLLSNIFDNAWKYQNGNKQIKISLRAEYIEGRNTFIIEDNGVGFAAADADRVFQPFERLPATEHIDGAGVGLSTSARIVNRHGGQIWAESEIGSGTKIFFTLTSE